MNQYSHQKFSGLHKVPCTSLVDREGPLLLVPGGRIRCLQFVASSRATYRGQILDVHRLIGWKGEIMNSNGDKTPCHAISNFPTLGLKFKQPRKTTLCRSRSRPPSPSVRHITILLSHTVPLQANRLFKNSLLLNVNIKTLNSR